MMSIRTERIEKNLREIATFGRLENGGVTRLAFSEADRGARAYLEKVMQDAGLEVRIDAAGNLFGRRAGREDLPPVVIGSHLDTVPEGGHFDGIVGVVAGLEVVRALDEEQVATRRPVEIVNFSAEESSRFGIATLGTKIITGKIGREQLSLLTDRDGISFFEALKRVGGAPDRLDEAVLRANSIHAFLELHIEQGPVLENRQVPVGIVTSIAAPTRFKVRIEGRADHSGTTPMALRKDALAAASEIVLGVERIAASEAGEHTVATVGYLNAAPGVMNVVPARAELGIDLRDICARSKGAARDKVLDLLLGTAERRGVIIAHEILSDDAPVELSAAVISLIEKAATDAELAYLKLPSGAGHDAMNMASVAPAGMIFVPSENGISHNIAERTRLEDICKGTEVLLRTIRMLAEDQPSA